MLRIFGHTVATPIASLLLVEAVACAIGLSIVLPEGAAAFQSDPPGAVLQLLLLALVAVMTVGALGLYESANWLRLPRLAVAAPLAAVSVAAVRGLIWPQEVTGSASGSGHLLDIILAIGLAIALVRLVFFVASRLGLLGRTVAVVLGPDGRAGLPFGPDAGRVFDDWFRIGLVAERPSSLRDPVIAHALKSGRIWAVVTFDSNPLPLSAIRRDAAGVRVFSGAEFHERRLSRLDVGNPVAGPAPEPRVEPLPWLSAVLRRGLDIVVSLVVLAVTLPLTLLAALAIKLDSPGPVLYRQERVGLNGRVFTILKFRSMRTDAETGSGPRWAVVGDSRVTRVGRVLRLTRVDEIPQMLNVLRGEMAFVGPRPERPCFVEQLRREIPQYDERHAVRPGVTGWAQVNLPYGASAEDARRKLAYDLYYVRHRSLFLDLLITLATVRVVLFREGAR
ncbi:MAG TPA: exopolysaccharide biosynthesis polyprenyl glycosylphosphotransferase [Salinarimonas sp.]|nr:exopolysaccharide biosynthesis polyprenyl glycosylphosphotransferase [Salinarimonas sp.]